MSRLRTWLLRLTRLQGDPAGDLEFADELASHLQLHINDNLRAGMTRSQARRDALVKLGGVDVARERYRDASTCRWLEDLSRDARAAIVRCKRNVGQTAAIVAAIATGVAVTSGVYAVVDGVLLHPFPYRDQDRLAVLWQADKSSPRFVVSAANYLDWKRSSRTFVDLAAIQPYKERSFAIAGGDYPEQIDGVRTTWNLFDVLGVPPLVGRTFDPRDSLVGSNNVVLLGYPLWMRRFGGIRSVVGQRILLNGVSTEIVGVLPEHFQLSPIDARIDAELFAPIAWTASEQQERSSSHYAVIGRLQPKISLDEARGELQAIAGRLEQAYPETNRGETVRIDPLRETIVGGVRPILMMLFTAAVILLILGSASVSNLLLARQIVRRKQFAIELALGATRGRIARELITETLVISAMAGVVGLLFASQAVRLLLAITPETAFFSIPRREEIGVEPHVFLFALAVMVTAALLTALPSVRAAMTVDPNPMLNEESIGVTADRSHARMRRFMMAGQIALALLLVIGTTLAVRSFSHLSAVNPGFRTDHVLTARLALPPTRYPGNAPILSFWDRLMAALSAQPGVQDVSLVNLPPLGGVSAAHTFRIVRAPTPPDGQLPSAMHTVVSPHYFELLGIRLTRGRTFTEGDNARAVPVVIISQTFADRFFPGIDPIGQQVILNDGGTNPREIIGVVGDVLRRLVLPPAPQMYVPFEQLPQRTMTLLLRSASDSLATASTLRSQVVATIDATQPISEVRPLQSFVRDARERYMVVALVLAAFAGAAMLITLCAVYGMAAHVTHQRQHEIGIRVALGAARVSLFGMLLRETVFVGAAGAAAGVSLSWALGHFLESVLFGIEAHDPAVFVMAPLASVTMCLLSAAVATRQFVRLEAIDAVRRR